MTENKTRDSITEYRINKLEEIVERLAENQIAQTRIESMGIQNQKTIERLILEMDEDRKVQNKMILKMNTIENDVDSMKWIIKIVAGVIVTAIVGAIMSGLLK